MNVSRDLGLRVSIVCLVLAWTATGVAQESPGSGMPSDPVLQERATQLAESIPLWMQKSEVPGMTLAGLWKGEFVGAAVWGIRSELTGKPVDEHTVFAAASLTKPVVAYIVLQLVDEGVLRLDQPLADVLLLPELADDPRAHDITVRMILSHSSGLPNWRWDRPLALLFDPGTKFQYSGEGYVWLSQVVEKVTGIDLQTLAEQRVFGPLAMTSSSLVWQERFASDLAVGHRDNGMAMDPQVDKEPNAAASLMTTSHDYALFLQAFLAGERLSSWLLEECFTPQVEVAPQVSWGLGWGIEEGSDGRALFQWGDNPGYKAFVTANLQTRTGVVVFTNSDNGMALMTEVVTTAMGTTQPGLDWLGYESFNSPRREVRRILERVLEREGTQATIDEYHSLKRRYPADAFQEALLNALGYNLMGQERYGEAIDLFTLNVEEYPDASNPYDSLGEAYMKKGDLERAIENYERSVELDPQNDNGRQMLDKLRKQIE